MAYSISDACLCCGSCLGECPTNAIEEGTPYTIEESKCTDCGACADTCPVEAITPS